MKHCRLAGWVSVKRPMFVGLALWGIALTPIVVRAAEETAIAPHEMTVDFAKPCGTLRPLHGVNNGPVIVGGLGQPDLTSYFRAAEIPNCRLHDAIWTGSMVVDIPFIFPLAHADPADANNYLFARTDDYIQGIISAGAQVVYRLGASIEHTKRKYDAHPPKDFDRWAEVCVHIIRHYNEGWANGFHHDIRYWEVWNEPNVGPMMWSGTKEDYYRLYAVTARAIKQHDPAMKVGGPALAGSGGVFLDQFLAYCRDQRAPLDFCSWHTYADKPIKIKKNAVAFQKTLARFGFPQVESLLTEWHYMNGSWDKLRADTAYRQAKFNELNGPAGAAFSAATLLMLQDTTVAIANYYTGDTLMWGLFSENGVPRKAYYAFKAFGQLLHTPQRVTCTGGNEDDGLAIGAGLDADRTNAQLLLANFESKATRFRIKLQHLPWKDVPQVEVLAVDAAHNLDSISKKRLDGPEAVLTVDCPAPSVLLIRLSP